MGFNLALLAVTEGNVLDLREPSHDADASGRILSHFSPRTNFHDLGTVPLDAGAYPPRGDVNLGVFRGGHLIATRDAALFNPTKLAPKYLRVATGRTIVLLTQQSAHDMFAYARWVDGHLVRSISVNPVGKIWESLGEPEAFEIPFWKGKRPGPADYPLPFHPLDLSDAALRAVLRLHFEGPPEDGLLDPSTVSLRAYQREH